MPHETHPCPVTRVTDGPFQHFFGYYEKTPWREDGRYLLGLRVAPIQRQVTADDVAVIGLIDTQRDHRWQPLAETLAWCWQQSTMMQWLGSSSNREIIFNVRNADGFGSMILDVETGERRALDRAVYGVDPRGRYALCANFARLDHTRPGYGYKGVADPFAKENAPAGDGITYLDLASGASQLIVSLAQLAEFEHEASMTGGPHWVNHLQISRSGARVAFLHRWRPPGAPKWQTRLFSADPDGGNLRLLAREGYTSHYDWRGDSQILAWSRHNGEAHYHLYDVETGAVDVVGADVLERDGHCSYGPTHAHSNGEWVLTDCYPDAERSVRTLILYHPATNRRIDIGDFYSPPALTGEIRCDLHPRWNRDGTQVCLDSAHEGMRQMYVVDVSEVVGN